MSDKQQASTSKNEAGSSVDLERLITEARKAIKPIIKKELEGEDLGSDILDFRLD